MSTISSTIPNNPKPAPIPSLQPAAPDPDQAQSSEVEDYLARGGKRTVYPAQECDKRKYRTGTIAKPGKQTKLSNSERERIPKHEALASRMSLSSPDFQSVPGTGTSKIEVGEIYAALAMGKLTEPETQLYIYYATEDKQSRSHAWALLMCELADRVIKDRWETRKRGILDCMANAVLEQLVYPEKFKGYSDRAWERKLGLGNKGSWSNYRNRYAELLSFAKEIINRGDDALRHQL